MSFRFAHNNINVFNLEKSLAFYQDVLGFQITREVVEDDFKIVFLGDNQTPHMIELTWLKNWDRPYNLGDNEIHLAVIASDFEKVFEEHKKMGIVCYINEKRGIYFITDPDGYWIEIIPER